MKDEGYLIIGNPFNNGDFSDGVFVYCLFFWMPILLVYRGLTNEPYIELFELLFGGILLFIAFVVAFLDLKSRKTIKISLNQIYIKDILILLWHSGKPINISLSLQVSNLYCV